MLDKKERVKVLLERIAYKRHVVIENYSDRINCMCEKEEMEGLLLAYNVQQYSILKDVDLFTNDIERFLYSDSNKINDSLIKLGKCNYYFDDIQYLFDNFSENLIFDYIIELIKHRNANAIKCINDNLNLFLTHVSIKEITEFISDIYKIDKSLSKNILLKFYKNCTKIDLKFELLKLLINYSDLSKLTKHVEEFLCSGEFEEDNTNRYYDEKVVFLFFNDILPEINIKNSNLVKNWLNIFFNFKMLYDYLEGAYSYVIQKSNSKTLDKKICDDTNRFKKSYLEASRLLVDFNSRDGGLNLNYVEEIIKLFYTSIRPWIN